MQKCMACCNHDGARVRDCSHLYCNECWINIEMNHGKCYTCGVLFRYARQYLNKRIGLDQEKVKEIVLTFGRHHWDLAVLKCSTKQPVLSGISFTVFIRQGDNETYGFSTFNTQLEAERFAKDKLIKYNTDNPETKDDGYFFFDIYRNVSGTPTKFDSPLKRMVFN